MKKLFSTLLLSMLLLRLFAQSPPMGISYQAVILSDEGVEISGVDPAGVALPEKTVDIRFSIISLDLNGTVDYAETHRTNTDRFGMITLTIGGGNQIGANSFASIDWGAGKKFLKVELDLNNGKGYKLLSIEQMMSVPYALYAKNTLSPGPAGPTGAQGNNGKNALINTSQVLPGINCAQGGVKVEIGLDTNSNGILDNSEIIASNTKYICNGANGIQGAQGLQGVQGIQGISGTNGVNGTNGIDG
ncbi:MAG: hypothetical protein KA981_04645, partial [Bacteroidia bacterium]|nr:hypothetical protein [Bacteroidia bacterium]